MEQVIKQTIQQVIHQAMRNTMHQNRTTEEKGIKLITLQNDFKVKKIMPVRNGKETSLDALGGLWCEYFDENKETTDYIRYCIAHNRTRDLNASDAYTFLISEPKVLKIHSGTFRSEVPERFIINNRLDYEAIAKEYNLIELTYKTFTQEIYNYCYILDPSIIKSHTIERHSEMSKKAFEPYLRYFDPCDI